MVTVKDQDNRSLGRGEVRSIDRNSRLWVRFPGSNMPLTPYQYPDCLRNNHLTFGLDNSDLSNRIKNDIQILTADSIAFKYTFCDGGIKNNKVGFCGVCSDERIKKNIEDGRKWCKNGPNFCRPYYDKFLMNNIPHEEARKELEEKYKNPNNFFCYESEFLNLNRPDNWKAKVGRDEDGTPRCIGADKNPLNGLGIITTRDNEKDDDTGERTRRIIAVFLINNFERGDRVENKEGEVCSDLDSVYRIVLTEEESRQLLFWNYYANNRNPARPQWNELLVRYLNNEQAARILSDIVDVIKDDDERKEKAKELLNKIWPFKEPIPERNGALTRVH